MTLLSDLLTPQLTCPSSLSLITSVLGASGSWYTRSLITHVLSRPTSTTVIHISFLHDAAFHRRTPPRGGGARYIFIDGLLGLFRPGKNGALEDFGDEASEVRRTIEGLVKGAAHDGSGSVVLVLENPDVLLAARGVAAMELVTEILGWHQVAPTTTPTKSRFHSPLLRLSASSRVC